MTRRRVKVTVIYKSGAVQKLKCKAFTATRNRLGELQSVEWDSPKPEPLFIGVDDIAAIYAEKTR